MLKISVTGCIVFVLKQKVYVFKQKHSKNQFLVETTSIPSVSGTIQHGRQPQNMTCPSSI